MTHVGATLGPYELVAELGSGGMATLYLAERTGPAGFSRPVAVKIVHPEHAEDPAFVRMFLDEARLSARVQHPNVVYVEELGEQDGLHYMVMEYVDGVTLADVLASLAGKRQALPLDIAVTIAAQVADGLHGAHESTDEHGRPLGLVHRDVSPQNILLSSRGHVKVIDFGIARAAGRLTSTERGALKGKIAYMAPEQLRGQIVDRRSDIFTLGTLRWEMLTMRRLFHSQKELQTIQKIRNAEVEAPSTYRPDLPEALDQVLLRALARERDDRFQTAHAFRRALLLAYPQSLMVDASAIAELVRDAARETLHARRRVVPDDLLEATIVSQPAWAELHDGDGETFAAGELVGESIPELEAQLGNAQTGADAIGEVRALGRLTSALIDGGELERAAQLLGQAEAVALERAPGMRGFIASLRGRLAASEGDLGARLRAQRSALELFEEAGWVRRAVRTAVSLAETYNQFGAFEAAEHELFAVLARARQLEMKDTESYALSTLGYSLTMQDRFAEAEANLTEALKIAEMRGEERVAMFSCICRADLLGRAGRWTAARAEAERIASLAHERNNTAIEAMALTQVARAALATGDRAAALDASERAYRSWKQLGSLEQGEGELLLTRVRALEAAGHENEAKRVREEAVQRIESLAVRIADLEWRRRFVRDVPSHAELLGPVVD